MVSILKGNGFNQVNELSDGALAAIENKNKKQAMNIIKELENFASEHEKRSGNPIQSKTKTTNDNTWLHGSKEANSAIEDANWHKQVAMYAKATAKELENILKDS